ncbi:DMT family transporter [Roseateles sp.]|uniref:DMT family transporter n=1 Tax=Roseateles sp. TaxID=1971397 RepID=UPI003D09CE33
MPWLFVLFWSSGYPVGKLGLAHAAPLSLLSLRFGLAAVLLLALAMISRAPWPRLARSWLHLGVVGLLIQVLHFAGVYQAMRWGLPSGVAALLIGLMPLLTAMGGYLWLAERIQPRQAWGLALGLAGVGLVVLAKPLQQAAGGGGGTAGLAYGVGLLGLAGLVLGTLYQKRFCAGMDLRSGSAIQMTVAALAMLVLAVVVEGGVQVEWRSEELWWVLLWLAGVNSIGAFSLMFSMVRRGSASRVAALFFLIPAMSTLMGWALLGEALPVLALLGLALSAAAVFLSARTPA